MQIQEFPVTIVIIVVTVLLSFRAFKDAELKYKWIFYPYKVNKENELYRIISHVFIHGDTLHLLFNMFVLFSFGQLMEHFLNFHFGVGLGSLHFFMLYFLGGLAASIWPYLRNKENPNYMSLGASGAVASVLFASILWYPQGGIYIMFIPFEIPAWLFGILYLGFEFYMSKKGGTNVAHDAHFGGAIFGILYVLLINFDKSTAFIEHILN